MRRSIFRGRGLCKRKRNHYNNTDTRVANRVNGNGGLTRKKMLAERNGVRQAYYNEYSYMPTDKHVHCDALGRMFEPALIERVPVSTTGVLHEKIWAGLLLRILVGDV